MTKYFLRKNDNNIEINKSQGNDKQPYFSLFIIPEEKDGKWIEVGAAWKSASGKGYTMKLKEGYTISMLPKEPMEDVSDLPDLTD